MIDDTLARGLDPLADEILVLDRMLQVVPQNRPGDAEAANKFTQLRSTKMVESASQLQHGFWGAERPRPDAAVANPFPI